MWPNAADCHGVYEGHRPPSVLLASITPIAVVTMAMPWSVNLGLNSVLLAVTTLLVYRMSSVNNEDQSIVGEIAGIV